jgi:hypothetical protein
MDTCWENNLSLHYHKIYVRGTDEINFYKQLTTDQAFQS